MTRRAVTRTQVCHPVQCSIIPATFYLLTHRVCIFSNTCLVPRSFQIFLYLPIQFSEKWILHLKLSLRLLVSLNDNNIWYYFIVTTSLYSLGKHNHSLKLQNENTGFFGTLYRWMEKVACQIPEEGMAPAQPQPGEQKQSSSL